MKFFLLGITCLVLLACGPNNDDTKTTARGAFETYIAAINSGEIDKAATFYDLAEGFHWIERGQVQYENGADAAKALQAFSTGEATSEMRLDNMRVANLTRTSALISTHFEFISLTGNGDTQFAFDGWMTVAMVKRQDGWKIAGGQTGPGSSE